MRERLRSITLVDDPIVINGGLAIPLREVQFRTSRSSGPGGQHANVTDSRVEAIFDVRESESLSPRQRELITDLSLIHI